MSAGNTGSAKAFINSFNSGRRASAASTEDKPKSPTSPTQFAGLMAHKRGTSADQGHQARRASWDEQKPTSGMVGGWWNKMMKG